MGKKLKRTCWLILLVLSCFVFGYTVPSMAASAGTASLKLVYKDGDKPIASARFSVLRVADVLPHGGYRVSEMFPGCSDSLHEGMTNDAWETAAKRFTDAAGVLEDASAVTDNDGTALFSDIAEGVYLVRGDPQEWNGSVCTPQAFCAVVLAGSVQEASPKFEAVKLPDETKQTEQTEQKTAEGTVRIGKSLELDGRRIVAPHAVFYVALFSDRECSRLAYGPEALEFNGSAYAEARFTGITPDRDYYFCETDASGSPIAEGDVSDIVFHPRYGKGNVLSVKAGQMAAASFVNEFPKMPKGYYFEPEEGATESESESMTEYESGEESESESEDTQVVSDGGTTGENGSDRSSDGGIQTGDLQSFAGMAVLSLGAFLLLMTAALSLRRRNIDR